ncbi:bromodomain associated, partial [Cooperia oncophora]
LDTPETKYSEELDAYANLLEDEAVGSSPAAPVRPVPLGIEAKSDGEIPPEIWPEDDPYEQVIRQSVAAICSSVGFDAIDANILETLAQRLKNYVCSISLGAKLHCEVAGRTIPIATDVWLALADIGHKVDQLPGYLRHLRVTGTIAIAPPLLSVRTSTCYLSMLRGNLVLILLMSMNSSHHFQNRIPISTRRYFSSNFEA